MKITFHKNEADHDSFNNMPECWRLLVKLYGTSEIGIKLENFRVGFVGYERSEKVVTDLNDQVSTFYTKKENGKQIALNKSEEIVDDFIWLIDQKIKKIDDEIERLEEQKEELSKVLPLKNKILVKIPFLKNKLNTLLNDKI